MKFYLHIVLLFLLAVSIPAQSIDTIPLIYQKVKLPFDLYEEVPIGRPRVALALSGGGARGLAQIGVLKAFKEADISIDLIVGTSMGSIIGGLYAAGYSIEELDSIARSADWNELLSLAGETSRRELFIDQKITEDRAVFALRLKGLNPMIPTSINDGQKLSNFLNLLTLNAPIHAENSFDDLLIKFRAVCTDLISGNKVIIDKGSLSQAMRASSSVSFLLSPVKIDSLILVDGGLVANIPVRIASELGGDYVIAVNTTSSLHGEQELNYPWLVADQIVSIPMKLLNESQLSGANIIITPKIDKRAATDFSNIDSLIDAGYKAALPFVERIRREIDSIYTSNLSKENNYYLRISAGEEIRRDFPLSKFYPEEDSISSKLIASDIYNYFDKNNYSMLKSIVIKRENGAELKLLKTKNARVKEVLLEGITLLNKNEVMNIVSPLIGKPFNRKEASGSILEILRSYRSRGYSLAELSNVSFNSENGILTLKFTEGKIGKILIEGNATTSSTIISREFPIRAGDYFMYDNIRRGLVNLRSTNLFDDIILTIRKVNGENVVVLKVLEKISSLVRVGFSTDNEAKAKLSLDLRDENIFGSGTELGMILSLGNRNRSYIFEHKANRIFNTYLTYKINSFYGLDDIFFYRNVPTNSDFRYSREAAGEYRQIYYGLSLSAGTQVERFGNLIVTGKYQIDEVKNTKEIFVNPYKATIVSLGISSTIDTQDKYPFPEKGFYLKIAYETAQTILGGDLGYTNFNINYLYYQTLGRGHTIAPRLSIGFADETLPLSRHYSLGGLNNFFGLNEDEFRGRQIFIASLGYRYRLPFKIFFDSYLRFRYDLGSAWEVQDQIRFKDLKHGIGGGLSFDTPVGPADFAVGRSFIFLKNLPENFISWGDIKFYFSIGYTF
jgi:NTE family protein